MINYYLPNKALIRIKTLHINFQIHQIYPQYKESNSIFLSEKSEGTLEATRGVRQMNGVPRSGADRYATA